MASYEGGVLRISNHSLSMIVACETKAVLYYLGYTQSYDIEAPLKCGVAIHEVLASYFVDGNKTKALYLLTKYYRSWADNHVPQDDRLSYDNVHRIISYWLDRNPIEKLPFTVVPEFVECGFEYPLLPDGTIILTGRPDAIVKDKYGKYWVVDHKTTQRISDDFIASYQLDAQMSGYWWVAEQMGLEVAGVWINAIELQALPSSNRVCKRHRVKYSECGTEHISYQLLAYTRTKKQVKEWYKTALVEALRFKELLDKIPDIRYIGDGARMTGVFGGHCKYCPFKLFCSHDRNPNLADKLMERRN